MQAKKKNQMTIKMPQAKTNYLKEPNLSSTATVSRTDDVHGENHPPKVEVPNERFIHKWRRPLNRQSHKKEKNAIVPLQDILLSENEPTARETQEQLVRYERIEEVAGRPIDEILLENAQLRNRRGDMNRHLEKLNQDIEVTKVILFQLVDSEINQNPSVALPVAAEYEIDQHHRRADKPVKDVAECLRKMRYYMSPASSDLAAEQERFRLLEQQAQLWQKENERLKQENERLALQNKEKERLAGKGMQIIVHRKEETPISEEPAIEGIEKRVSEWQAREREAEGIAEEAVAASTESFAVDRPTIGEEEETTETTRDEQKEEQEMLNELNKPKYQMLLDRKGYDYRPSPNPKYDLMIQKETGDAVPLIYIDYSIQKPEMFDEIMEKTNQIYFLFDNKESMKKGNMKFTSWLLKSKKKKRLVQFSFTTIDELKTRGLDELNSL